MWSFFQGWNLLSLLIFGAVVGWLASVVMGRSRRMGCLANIVIGILGAMIADICDIDEMNSGMRRQGSYGAIGAVFGKGIIAATGILTGYILALSGYVETQEPTAQTILNMRILFIVIPGTLMLIALFLASRYPITEQQVLDVRRRLEARRRALGVTEAMPV